jgi:predicted aspartyl protease
VTVLPRLGRPVERGTVVADPLAAAIDSGDMLALTRYLQGADPATRQRFVAGMNTLLRSGQLRDATAMLTAYLEDEPFDAQALFALSDAWQMQGQWRRALDPLFNVLQAPPTLSDADQARLRSQQLIDAREQQLLNLGDIAGLVRFFEWLTAREPANDAHRLSLVRWLLRSDDVDAAQRVFKETGTVGITDAARQAVGDELRDELAARQFPVQIEREGDSLYLTLAAAGDAAYPLHDVRMLVDTGSSMTSMAPAVLRRLKARRLDTQVSVETANGTLLVNVYRVVDVRLGSMKIDTLQVLELPGLPAGVEGLLGMDVLSKVPGGMPKGVGTP